MFNRKMAADEAHEFMEMNAGCPKKKNIHRYFFSPKNKLLFSNNRSPTKYVASNPGQMETFQIFSLYKTNFISNIY